MEDVIRTSLLSRRWRYLWLSVPCIDFTSLKMSRLKSLAFIDRSLVLHKGSKAQKLSISLKYTGRSLAYEVDTWIRFAITRNVNELYLDFLKTDKMAYNFLHPTPNPYKLPHSLFNSGSLTALTLKHCNLNLPVILKLSSLKTLSLEQLNFSDGTINDFISSCPLLEYLCLTNCNIKCDFNIFITNVAMKTLKIHELNDCCPRTKFEIYALHLISFELLTSMPRNDYVAKRLGSLENASLDCSGFHSYCMELYRKDKQNKLVKILDELRHVRNLTLGSCYIQVLPLREVQKLDSLSLDATYLGLKVGLIKWELPGIAYMIRGSPDIETLIINIDEVVELCDQSKNKYDFEDGEYWGLQEPKFSNLLQNLNIVKIYGFMKNLNGLHIDPMSTTIEELLEQLENDLNFLGFLLKNSRLLQKMIIRTCKNVHSGKWESKKFALFFHLTQKLLAFPRASRAAEISFI